MQLASKETSKSAKKIEILKAMMAAGADPHVKVFGSGWNALMQAVETGDAAFVNELIELERENGIVQVLRLVATKNSAGETALDLAHAGRHHTIADLLGAWTTYGHFMARHPRASREAAIDPQDLVQKRIEVALPLAADAKGEADATGRLVRCVEKSTGRRVARTLGLVAVGAPLGCQAAVRGGERAQILTYVDTGKTEDEQGVKLRPERVRDELVPVSRTGLVTHFSKGRFLGFGPSKHTVAFVGGGGEHGPGSEPAAAAAATAPEQVLLLRWRASSGGGRCALADNFAARSNAGVPFVVIDA